MRWRGEQFEFALFPSNYDDDRDSSFCFATLIFHHRPVIKIDSLGKAIRMMSSASTGVTLGIEGSEKDGNCRLVNMRATFLLDVNAPTYHTAATLWDGFTNLLGSRDSLLKSLSDGDCI